jgi:hypothetical protein
VDVKTTGVASSETKAFQLSREKREALWRTRTADLSLPSRVSFLMCPFLCPRAVDEVDNSFADGGRLHIWCRTDARWSGEITGCKIDQDSY